MVLSFNEAPIHESGKCVRTGGGHQGHAASMRPRFMNRGSSGTRPPRGAWCPRFNEAPIHESGKSGCATAPASLPDDRFNEAPIHESGKSPGAHDIEAQLVASMRPRFMNRGSQARQAAPTEATAASMRPRFMNRGSPLVHLGMLAARGLQ